MKFEDLLTITGEWTYETNINIILCDRATNPQFCDVKTFKDDFGHLEVIGFSKDLIVLKVDEASKNLLP